MLAGLPMEIEDPPNATEAHENRPPYLALHLCPEGLTDLDLK